MFSFSEHYRIGFLFQLINLNDSNHIFNRSGMAGKAHPVNIVIITMTIINFTFMDFPCWLPTPSISASHCVFPRYMVCSWYPLPVLSSRPEMARQLHLRTQPYQLFLPGFGHPLIAVLPPEANSLFLITTFTRKIRIIRDRPHLTARVIMPSTAFQLVFDAFNSTDF